jgi:hypothetical protein
MEEQKSNSLKVKDKRHEHRYAIKDKERPKFDNDEFSQEHEP